MRRATKPSPGASLAEVAVRLPPLDDLARRWGEIEPLLKRATDRTDCYEPIDLLCLAVAGRMQLWTAERGSAILAAAVSEVRQHPRARVLEVPFVGGRSLFLWAKPLLAALDDYARATKCGAVMGFDRAGWSRFGFRITGSVMERRVS
jgi:hypothetical protein